MPSNKTRIALILGGTGMVFASLFHIVVMFGGPDWVEFAGAPLHIVQSFRDGTMEGPTVTLFIAAILAIWAAYAFSGADKLRKFPLLKTGIGVIGILLTLRGLAFPFMIRGWDWTNPNLLFHGVLSVGILGLGICYLVGLWGLVKSN